MRKMILWMIVLLIMFNIAYSQTPQPGCPPGGSTLGAAADADAAASAAGGITTTTSTTQTPSTGPSASQVSSYLNNPIPTPPAKQVVSSADRQRFLNEIEQFGYTEEYIRSVVSADDIRKYGIEEATVRKFQSDMGFELLDTDNDHSNDVDGDIGAGTVTALNELYTAQGNQLSVGGYDVQVSAARADAYRTIEVLQGTTDPKNLQGMTLDDINNARTLLDQLEHTGADPKDIARDRARLDKAEEELKVLESIKGMTYDEIEKGIDDGTIDKKAFDYMDKYNEDLAKDMRTQRRASNVAWAEDHFSWANPNGFSRQMQEWVNGWFGTDVGFKKTADALKKTKFFGYGMSGYETAICDAAYDIPEQFVQDYPGHFVAGGTLPGAGSLLVLLGRRTEYNSPDSQTGWFVEIQPDGTLKEKGYLYKISFTINNKVSQAEYDEMESWQREDAGLSDNGTLSYTLTISGTKPDGSAASYVWDSLPGIEPGGRKSQTFAFYDKAELTTLKLKFNNGYTYNNADSEKTATIVVTNLQSNVPATFNYNPPAEQTESITYSYPDGSTVAADSTECTAPPDWCCNQGITRYC